MGHRFQWLQSESFVKRRKDKDFRRVVKHAQHFDGHESHKAYVVLHAVADHGAAKVGMLGKFIADDNELKVRKKRLLFQFRFECSEGLNDPHQILMRSNASCIEQKRVSHLITLHQCLTVGLRRMAHEKPFIDSVVDDLDMLVWYTKQFLDLALG